MNLHEIIDIALLRRMEEEGYIRTQKHPEFPLTIYNYTEKAQFEGVWNEATRVCRGLIVDDNLNIIARPFPKFFNYGDLGAAHIDLADLCVAMDKMDGSLGIMYVWEGNAYIATRGSFESDQAKRANKILREKYSDFVPPENQTYLFEIIYPQNRIVVDYGDEEDLWFLGSVSIERGYVFPHIYLPAFPFPAAQLLIPGVNPFSEILMIPEREGQEGMVIYSGNKMLKIKQADYVELHRLVTGLSEKMVWKWLGDNKPLDDLISQMPDEFHEWINDAASDLYEKAGKIVVDVDDEFQCIMSDLRGGKNWWEVEVPRKDFAFKAMRSEYSGLLFMRYDSKDIWPKVWDMVKPVGDSRIFARSEDVA